MIAFRQRAGMFLLATSLLLAAAEFALRIGWGLGSPPLYQADPEIGYLFKPNQNLKRFSRRIHINAFSQRSGNVSPTPHANTTRILVLGDSVSWGGVLTDQAETYPALLEANLNSRSGRLFEVLNASSGSWSFGNLLAYAERFGFFGSSLLILQIGTEDLLQPKSTSANLENRPDMPTRNPPAALAEILMRYILPRIKAPPSFKPAQSSGAFEANMRCFERIVELARNEGIHVAVVYTPLREEVLSIKEPDPFRSRFVAMCEELGIPVANLVAEWRGNPDAHSWYRDYIHLNVAGNRRIAAYLQEFILAQFGALR